MIVRHPFIIVPFPETLSREPWPERGAGGHETFRKGAFSGEFVCTLTTVTALCIKEHFRILHWDQKAPFIPGSSIRGMLRNTMQVLGFGCAGQQYQNQKARDQAEAELIPKLELGHMGPCTRESACMVCRIFGYAVNDGSEEKAAPFGWAGKVRVLDSAEAPLWRQEMWKGINEVACSVAGYDPAQPQDHGPKRLAFYYKDGRPAGWKVYRHAKQVTRIHDSGVETPNYHSHDCVPARMSFAFRLEFENLTPSEYSALEFVLTLSHTCPTHSAENAIELAHKLGYGKGVGLGSCRITIDQRIFQSAARFLGETGGGNPPAFNLDEMFSSEVLKSVVKARKVKGAPDLLLFPKWTWFGRELKGTIGKFDQDLGAQELHVECPPPPAPEALPGSVRCVITGMKAIIKGETAEEYNGHKYRFEVPAHAGVGKVTNGDAITVSVDPKGVDHAAHRFRGQRWQK